MQRFENASEYLEALDADADYAILPIQMAADVLSVGRSAIVHRVRMGNLEAIEICNTRYILAASLSNVLSMHRSEVETIKRFLVEIARCQRATTYAPVMGKIDRSSTVPNDRSVIGKILGEISRDSFSQHGFLLSALVMKGKLGRPSDAFFELALELDPRYKKTASDESYLGNQLDRIHAHYASN